MIEFNHVKIAPHIFEIISVIIAVAALVYAALAFKAAKHAIQATKDSDVTALRVKVQDGVSEAERSMQRLQKACQRTRDQWNRHISQHYPPLSRPFESPKETQHISELEQTGFKLLRELIETTSTEENAEAPVLEGYIRHAQSTSIQIERLSLKLETPRPLRH